MARQQKLNDKERKYIETNYHELTRNELAVAIGKPVWLVAQHIEDISAKPKRVFRKDEIPQDNPSEDNEPDAIICEELRAKHEWKNLRKELSDSELKFFEQSYKTLLDQFQGDVLPTEERQIMQAIKLEVFMHRNERNKLQIEMDILSIDEQISDEESIPIQNRNDSKYMNLKAQRQSLMSAAPSLSREWKECFEQHAKIMTTLRGTREQRVKQAADAKTNILGLLKEFQTEKFRKAQALSMEVNKFALEEELKRLSAPHTYMDGEVDRPILNWETDVDDEDDIPIDEEELTDANS